MGEVGVPTVGVAKRRGSEKKEIWVKLTLKVAGTGRGPVKEDCEGQGSGVRAGDRKDGRPRSQGKSTGDTVRCCLEVTFWRPELYCV